MKSMEDRQYHSGNTQKDSQENQVTYENVLNLLGIKELSALDTEELRSFAVKGMKDILARHDPVWVTQNRVRLIEELEQIAEM